MTMAERITRREFFLAQIFVPSDWRRLHAEQVVMEMFLLYTSPLLGLGFADGRFWGETLWAYH